MDKFASSYDNCIVLKNFAISYVKSYRTEKFCYLIRQIILYCKNFQSYHIVLKNFPSSVPTVELKKITSLRTNLQPQMTNHILKNVASNGPNVKLKNH